MRSANSVYILGFLLFTNTVYSEEVFLKIPLGNLIGRTDITPDGTQYYSFQKIPFARPPVGKLRFQAPVPIQNSTKTFNNTESDVICPQMYNRPFSHMEKEDCLYLNVYTPKLPSNKTNVSLPVLVYFYGGGFIIGYAIKSVYGPDFLIEKEIIVVTVNYRVGAFGFLSTQDNVIPGNAGLKDQRLSPQWVQGNIKYFGGDPSKVTIAGHSAGSASVIYHLLNNKNKGLFRGGIAESGSALSVWSYQRKSREIAFNLTRLIDKTFISSNSEDLRKLLVNATLLQIKEASLIIANNYPNQIETSFVFAPVLEAEHEDAFITEYQYELLAESSFQKVPLLIGFTSEEAIAFYNATVLLTLAKDLDANPEKLVPLGMKISHSQDTLQVGNAIRNLYCFNSTFEKNTKKVLRYASDNAFNRPAIKTAEFVSKWTDVYFYQFSYKGGVSHKARKEASWEDNVPHGAERYYLWVFRDLNRNFSKFSNEDNIVHQRLVKLYTNFVKNLNPSFVDEGEDIIWPAITSEGPENFMYMNINVTMDVLNHPKEDTYRGWQKIYDTYGVRPYDTF